jgi:hypothetical protein
LYVELEPASPPVIVTGVEVPTLNAMGGCCNDEGPARAVSVGIREYSSPDVKEGADGLDEDAA